MFKSRICRSNWKVSWLGGISREHDRLVLRPWKDMRRNTWNDVANWQTKQLSNCTKLKPVGELSKIGFSYVLKWIYLAHFGRSDTLWSVNKLARSFKKWTRTCDRRLARLMSYIHNTSDCRQYCHAGNTAQHCRLEICLDSDFAGRSSRLKIDLGWISVYLRESNIRSHKLGGQEANFSFTQFYWIWG